MEITVIDCVIGDQRYRVVGRAAWAQFEGKSDMAGIKGTVPLTSDMPQEDPDSYVGVDINLANKIFLEKDTAILDLYATELEVWDTRMAEKALERAGVGLTGWLGLGKIFLSVQECLEPELETPEQMARYPEGIPEDGEVWLWQKTPGGAS